MHAVVSIPAPDQDGGVGAMEWRTDWDAMYQVAQQWIETKDEDRHVVTIYDVTVPAGARESDPATFSDVLDDLLLGEDEFPGYSVRERFTMIPSNEDAEALPVVILDETDDAHAVVVCPHCAAEDRIAEIDVAVRNNEGTFEIEDGKIAHVAWSEQDSNFEHSAYRCLECRGEIVMPDDLSEDWH